jgi:hypothetical protein
MNIIIGEGSPRDRDHIPLATKRKTPIINVRRMEQCPEQLRAAIEVWERLRPDAIYRSISATYNCMGLVFGCRRTIIDIDSLRMILVEDGYRRVPSETDLTIGDVVIYRLAGYGNKHVGIVSEKRLAPATASWKIQVLSKWGSDGEYFHDINYVPDAYGRPAEFWTDRRERP